MAFRPHPARAPSVLLREAKPLKAIFGHAKRLAHLQRLLESQLQPAAREHCHVASWREGSLLLIVTDGHDIFVLTGAGDVLEPENDVAAIGSGGNFALAAARGLMETDLTAEVIARKAMAIAADICVYTNGNLTVERIRK